MRGEKEYFGKSVVLAGMAVFGAILVASILFSLSANPQPSIDTVTDSPDPVEIPGYNNITATVSAGPYFPYDTTGDSVDDVRVIIYYPNGTLWGNFSMTRMDSTTTWYFNYTYDASFPLGKYTYYIWTVDAYDWNESGPYDFTLQDTIPPVTNKDIGNPQNRSGVFINSSTPIWLNATDSGSGVNSTYYCIYNSTGRHPTGIGDAYGGNNNITSYNGSWWYVYRSYNASNPVDFGPIYFTEECVHYIEFFSVDNASNEENHTIQVHYVDNTPPEVTVEYGQPNYVNVSGAQFITKDTPIYLNATDDNNEITKLSPGVPMVWPFWALSYIGTGYNISAVVENYYIGTVGIEASYNISDSAIPLSSLTWDDMAGRTWTPTESYTITTLVPAQFLSEIPISPGDAAVIVRYNVTVDGNVVARFIGEALLSWSGSTPSIIGTLTNFDVHNNFTLVNNFELEIKGISQENITEIYPGWGMPANITDDGNWVNITWMNVTDPIYYCNWTHFGLGLDEGVILGDITNMRANWTVKCAVGSYRIWYRIWNETGAMTEPIPGIWNQSVVFNLSQLGITENCTHYIEYWAEDDLGNTQAEHFNETVYVDNVPPDINMTIGNPQYPGIGGTFVNFSTPIWVNATDNGTEPCIVGSVNLTVDVYNATTGTRIAHYTTDVENGWAHIGPFNINEECVHWINITARDDLNNTAYYNKTVYVDNTPPVLQKEIGEPKYLREETILFEDFESGVPPAGWTISGSLPWKRNDEWGRPNYAGGYGYCADADSNAYGGAGDAYLMTPAIDLSGYNSSTLSFIASYKDSGWVGSFDYANVDISIDGGTTWSNLLHWDGSHDANGPGEHVTIDLTPYVGNSNVIIRWHYHTQEYDWYWYEIDNVTITGTKTYITSQTPIYLNITDGGTEPCIVGSLHVKVGVWYDGEWAYVWYNQTDSPMNLTVYLGGDCIHYLNVTMFDDLNNTAYYNETFYVDNTPPETTIEWGNPQYWNGSMWYVNLSTQVWLNTSENYTDTHLCDVGCNYTYYEVWYDSDNDDVVDAIEQSGMELDNDITFYFTHECLHKVIYYGVDYLGNKEANHTVWFRVDDTPPVSIIDAIIPYCQHINATNPLTISATITDYPVLCPSGVYNATLWYRYARYNHSFTDWFVVGIDDTEPWQWQFTAPNGSGYYQFYVAAYDNLGQQEQPFPPNGTTLPKERVSASYNHTFELHYNSTGWNLITMPVKHKTIHTASDLVDYINAFSPDACNVVTKWDREEQKYVSYVIPGTGDDYGVDFTIVPGEGYFVYVTKNVTIYMEGCLIEYDEINLTLNVGYNMIGWANLEEFNASQIAGNISGCKKVAKWNSSAQRWFIPEYLVTDPAHDFSITIGEAMFVFRPTGGTVQWDGGRGMLVLPPP